MISRSCGRPIHDEVEIQRPVDEVFAFYRDFSNLPLLIGDVVTVETLTLPLGVIGRAALALVGKFPAAEVRANLDRLKRLLERSKG